MATRNIRIKIEPVSPGTTQEAKRLHIGDGSYATEVYEPRELCIQVTDAQIVGLQGYLVLIAAGTNTGAIETAITGVGPT